MILDRGGWPSFGIVTVTKNNLAGLQETIRSLDQQTYRHWHQYIQDGDSNDGTQEFIRLSHGTSNFESVADSGIYDAMNRALARVRGDLVWFLNAGDTLANPLVLEMVAASYMESRWMWAIGGMNWERRSGAKSYREPSLPRPWRVFWGLDVFPHPSCVFELSLIKELGAYSMVIRVAADQDLCLRALEVGKPALLDFPLANFEPGGGSAQMTIRELDQDLADLRRARGAEFLGCTLPDRLATRSISAARAAKRLVWDRR